MHVHPSFRIIATANLGRDVGQWLEPSLRALFGTLRELPWAPVWDPVRRLAPLLAPAAAKRLLAYAAQSREVLVPT